MIVLKYQDSTTDKFFENARRYQSFLGRGAKHNQQKKVFGGSKLEKFSKLCESKIDINNIFPYLNFLELRKFLKCGPTGAYLFDFVCRNSPPKKLVSPSVFKVCLTSRGILVFLDNYFLKIFKHK